MRDTDSGAKPADRVQPQAADSDPAARPGEIWKASQMGLDQLVDP